MCVSFSLAALLCWYALGFKFRVLHAHNVCLIFAAVKAVPHLVYGRMDIYRKLRLYR